MATVLGVGIVGSGFMARTYAECLSRFVVGARLSAVAVGERAAGLAQDFSVNREESVAALVDRTDVDAVIITTPEMVHREHTETAADAGVHVLVEKPMATTLSDCDAMIAACASADVKLAQVKHWRFRDVYLAGRRQIDEGHLGTIRTIRHHGWQPLAGTKSVVADKPFYLDPAGGGFYMGWNTHCFDLIRWLAGGEPRYVYASGPPFQADGAGDDLITLAQIEFDNGVNAQLWGDVAFPSGAADIADRFRTAVVGTEGWLDLAGYRFADFGGPNETRMTRLHTEADFDITDSSSPERLRAYAAMVQELVDSVREDRDPTVGGADGRAAVSLCVATAASARSGRRETVDSHTGTSQT